MDVTRSLERVKVSSWKAAEGTQDCVAFRACLLCFGSSPGACISRLSAVTERLLACWGSKGWTQCFAHTGLSVLDAFV